MTNRRAARQYAQALLSVATRSGRVEAVTTDLTAINDLVSGSAELQRLFESPSVPPKKKLAVVEALLASAGIASDEVHRLLTLLADRDRLALIGDVTEAFGTAATNAGRVVPANVVTAVSLTDSGKSALTGALSKAVGRDVEISARVDPAILGGVVAQVGSIVFDGSIARQVERLRTKLLAGA